ncbi:glycine C-acetyltransferase [Candidatus Nomurabacteria bacterium]|nr:glycine C-acetyltransferase [Candidatus Nomurabacteria bacterium]
MYTKKITDQIEGDLKAIADNGKYKTERLIEGAQGTHVIVDGKEMIMFASNNYLGLANHPELIKASVEGMSKFGFGTASVRFLSGTQTIHRDLEKKIAKFIGTEDVILYSTNFMSNLGLFATLVNEPFGSTEPWKDVIYSDANNHASIIDAFKLCKKENLDKRIYKGGDTAMLAQFLEEDKNKNYRNKIIVTDGIFSMEGTMADLPKLIELAEKYEALLFVDDAHGIGVMGENGKGTAEAQEVFGKIDIISGTLGKALGGAIGGYIGGKKSLVDLLRQKSRTYLFSNAVPASIVNAGIASLDMLEADNSFTKKVKENASYFRTKLEENNWPTLPGSHAIVPLMIGDAMKASDLSKKLFENGIYATSLSFPVVPEGEARIRFQLSALHTKEDIDKTIEIIKKVW